jgi:hypothetical protein
MIKRFIWWNFPRASWQYDVMVGLILAFLFLTPRAWFSDQPRLPGAGKIVVLPSEPGTAVYWVETHFLADIPESQRAGRLTQQLRVQTGDRNLAISRIEPVLDSEGQIQGYMVFARP